MRKHWVPYSRHTSGSTLSARSYLLNVPALKWGPGWGPGRDHRSCHSANDTVGCQLKANALFRHSLLRASLLSYFSWNSPEMALLSRRITFHQNVADDIPVVLVAWEMTRGGTTCQPCLVACI